MPRFSPNDGWMAAAALPVLLCAVMLAVPANTQPMRPLPKSPATPEDTQKLFGLLSKGYTPADCQLHDPAGNQLAAVSCDINSDSGGPISATYALYRDAASLQSAFFSIIGPIQLVPCPGVNQSPTVWHYQGSPDQTAGSIACGNLDTLSQVVWTNNANLMLGATESIDDVPRHYQWWLAEG
jgi:hypothetical protein